MTEPVRRTLACSRLQRITTFSLTGSQSKTAVYKVAGAIGPSQPLLDWYRYEIKTNKNKQNMTKNNSIMHAPETLARIAKCRTTDSIIFTVTQSLLS